MDQIPNCLIVSSTRCFMFSLESGDGNEEIPVEQKHALIMMNLLKSGNIDFRDHIFLSPGTNECVSIQGEVIKRFRFLRDNSSDDAEWFIHFDESYHPQQVAVALAKPDDNETWKMSAHSLNASKSPLEIYQNEACGVDSQVFDEDRHVHVVDNRHKM